MALKRIKGHNTGLVQPSAARNLERPGMVGGLNVCLLIMVTRQSWARYWSLEAWIVVLKGYKDGMVVRNHGCASWNHGLKNILPM